MREMPKIDRPHSHSAAAAARSAAETMFDLLCWNAEREYEGQVGKHGKDSVEAVAANEDWIRVGAQARLAKSQLLNQLSQIKINT